MKSIAFLTSFLILFQPMLAIASSGLRPEEVIEDVNSQLKERATAKVEMKYERGGKVRKTEEWGLLMLVENGKETIEGKIQKPASRKGSSLTVTWVSGRALIEHMRQVRGKVTHFSVGLEMSFFGGFDYVDVKVLEDVENYTFKWVSENIIEAPIKDPRLTANAVYTKKVLTVRKVGGRWRIERVEYYKRDAGGKLRKAKTRENKNFVEVYGGYRPGVIVVRKEKSDSTTTLELDWKSKTEFD